MYSLRSSSLEPLRLGSFLVCCRLRWLEEEGSCLCLLLRLDMALPQLRKKRKTARPKQKKKRTRRKATKEGTPSHVPLSPRLMEGQSDGELKAPGAVLHRGQAPRGRPPLKQRADTSTPKALSQNGYGPVL